MAIIGDGEHDGGNAWMSWVKLGSYGIGVGTVIFGMFSGFWQIDARLEAHGKTLETLAHSVKSLSDRSASLDAVDSRIEMACLRMQIANKGRFLCPFGPAEQHVPAQVKRAPVKASASVSSRQ